VAVAIKRRMLGGRRDRPRGFDDLFRVRSDEPVPPRFDRLDPLRVLAEREAGHAVPIRLLLHPARVGQDDPRLRGKGREVEVANRGQRADVAAELYALFGEGRARAWVQREDDRLVEERESLGDPPQSRRPHVGLAMQGRERVGAWLDLRLREGVRVLACDRCETDVRVEHDVADDTDAADDPLPLEVRRGVLGRAEEER
jgi:hypothetical protein